MLYARTRGLLFRCSCNGEIGLSWLIRCYRLEICNGIYFSTVIFICRGGAGSFRNDYQRDNQNDHSKRNDCQDAFLLQLIYRRNSGRYFGWRGSGELAGRLNLFPYGYIVHKIEMEYLAQQAQRFKIRLRPSVFP